MKNKNIHSALFDRSGNLTVRTIERYLGNLLTKDEREEVESRLAESPFDREAVEGYRKFGEADLDGITAELNKKILASGKARHRPVTPVRRTRVYLAAAASLAAVVILTAVLFYQLRRSDERTEMALVRDDTSGLTVGGIGKDVSDPLISSKMSTESTEIARLASDDVYSGDEEVSRSDEGLKDIEPSERPTAVAVQKEFEAPSIPENVIVPRISIEVDSDQLAAETDNDFTPGEPSVLPDFSGEITGVSAAKDAERKASFHRSDSQPKRGVTTSITQVPDTTAEEDNVFLSVSQMPSYPGGDTALNRFIATNTQYPLLAMENQIEGKVFVWFIVEKDGSVSNAQVSRGIGYGCNEEALRVIGMTRWNPGKQYGQAVRVQLQYEIRFRLAPQ